MPNDDAPATAPPQLSPDGHWWWDGAEWIPAAQRPGEQAPAPVVQEPVVTEPVVQPPVVAEPAVAGSWAAAAPMPGNGIPHQAQPQAFAPQFFGGQVLPAQPHSRPGYSLAVAEPPGKTLGIVSFVLSLVWMGGLGSIAAVVTGHLSRSKDRKAGAPQSGLALAGLIIGYVGIVLLPFLAAIAIPTFLHQRELGYAAGVKADLRAAAVVQEELMTDTGSYATSAGELSALGYASGPEVRIEVLAGDGTWYCLGGVRPEIGDALYYDSRTGTVSPTPCY